MSTMKTRKKYDQKFKDDAVEYYFNSGKSCAEVSKSLGISENSLYKWTSQYKENPENNSKVDLASENKRLRKELADAKMERDILKKAMAVFTREK